MSLAQNRFLGTVFIRIFTYMEWTSKLDAISFIFEMVFNLSVRVSPCTNQAASLVTRVGPVSYTHLTLPTIYSV